MGFFIDLVDLSKFCLKIAIGFCGIGFCFRQEKVLYLHGIISCKNEPVTSFLLLFVPDNVMSYDIFNLNAE